MPDYAYLGPSGTFTEAALVQIPGAESAARQPVKDAAQALEWVRSGRVDGAMLPIENSIEGGVSATLDAIATSEQLLISQEVVIPVTFVLAAREGLSQKELTGVSTHPHAWAQTRGWLSRNVPGAEFTPATSTAAGATLVTQSDSAVAAVCSRFVADQLGLTVLAEGIEDNPGAVTRFVLVTGSGMIPEPTGADKTTVAIPLPEDHPGALMDILDQFATRGINLSRIESRPTGKYLGHYFFSVDAEGHVADARMADALVALHRISPGLRFLGSYPRADAQQPVVHDRNADAAFTEANAWLDAIVQNVPHREDSR